jgi:hypothetical protein
LANHLEIEEITDGLLIRITRQKVVGRAAVSGIFALILVLIVGPHFLSWPITIALAALLGVGDWVSIMRGRVGELRVTDREFRSRAYIDGWSLTNRRIPARDIHWLEFQEDTTGPETAHHPGGLYAVIERSSICLLPDADESQTSEIIERIWQRFPEFQKRCAKRSAFEGHYTLLHLEGE